MALARKSRIAEAYVQVVPSFSGGAQTLQVGLQRILMAAGTNSASSFNRALGNGLNNNGYVTTKARQLVGGLTNVIAEGFDSAISNIGLGAKIGTGLLAGLAATGAAFAAKGGISRALAIEDASSTLEGLKYNAAQISSISATVLEAVTGTRFAFDEAMKISTSALAAGVPEGDGISNYIKLISDTATIAGSSLSDIGRIFNEVQANGRVYTRDLLQLTSRGIPVYAWLQKQLGMTGEELKKSLEAGEISSSIFLKSISDNISGAASQSASTTKGIVSNTVTAINALVANSTGPAIFLFRDNLARFLPILKDFNTRAKPITDAFWEQFSAKAQPEVDKAYNVLLGLVTGTNRFRDYQPFAFIADNVEKIVETVKPAGAPLKAFFDNLLGSTAKIGQNSALPAFYGLLTGLTTGVIAALPYLETARRSIEWFILGTNPGKTNIGMIFSGISEAVRPALPALKQIGGVLAGVFGAAVESGALPILLGGLTSLSGIIAALAPGVSTVGQALIAALPTVGAVGAQLLIFAGGVITQALPAIVALASSAVDLIPIFASLIGVGGEFAANMLTVLIPVLIVGAEAISNLTGFLAENEGTMKTLATLVALAGTGWLVYRGIMIGTVAVTNAVRLAQLGLAAAIGLVTGAQNALIIASLSNPFGWIAVAAGTLIGLFALMINSGVKVGDIWKGIGNIGINAVNGISSGINFLIGALNNVSLFINSILQSIGLNLGNSALKISNIGMVPQLATGANVMGPTLAMIGEGGRPETVTDLGLTNRMISSTNDLLDRVNNGEVSSTSSNEGGNQFIVNNDITASDFMTAEEIANKTAEGVRKIARRPPK